MKTTTIGKRFYASRIKFHLKRLGITQVELARRLDLDSPSAVTNWCKGTNNPAAHRLGKVAAALETDLPTFLGPLPRR